MTILVLFHTHRFHDLRSFYLGYICQHIRKEFPHNRVLQPLRGATGAGQRTVAALPSYRPISIGKSTMRWFYGLKLHLVTKIKKNMKNSLINLHNKLMLRKRSIIETVNDELKNVCQIEHTRHCSVNNFATNLLVGLIAYNLAQEAINEH